MFSRFSFPWRRPSARSFTVHLLDGNTLQCDLESRASGEELLNRVLREVGVQEGEYFGLISTDGGYAKWIQTQKPLKKQLTGRSPYTLYFRVRVYPKDHHIIISHEARHQLFMQVRHDLKEKRLKCNVTTLTQLAALATQADIGDFDPVSCGANYISEVFAMPRMGGELEETVVQFHRLNRGKPPGVCEVEFLETAQDTTTYGSVEYKVQDTHRNPVTLSSSPVGITVLRGGLDTTYVEWDCILRVANRGKHITLHISTTHTLAAYQQTFTCASSHMAANLSALLAQLQEFYSSTELEIPRSKLKRFFSSRRSMRHRNPPPRSSFIHPSTNPSQRRGAAPQTARRSSYSGAVPTSSQRFQDLAISIDYTSPTHQPPPTSTPTGSGTLTSEHAHSNHMPRGESDKALHRQSSGGSTPHTSTPSHSTPTLPQLPGSKAVMVELNSPPPPTPNTATGQYIDQTAPVHVRSRSNPEDVLYSVNNWHSPHSSTSHNHPLPSHANTSLDHPLPPHASTSHSHPLPPHTSTSHSHHLPPHTSTSHNHPLPPHTSTSHNHPTRPRTAPSHHHKLPAGVGRRRSSNGYSPSKGQRMRCERVKHSPHAHEVMPSLEESTNQVPPQVKRKSVSLPREPSTSPPHHPAADGLESMDSVVMFLDRSLGTGSKMDKWRAYAAKPRNRPRLSLQDAKYYDTRGPKKTMHRMETFGGDTGYHLQNSLEGGSYLGSITSLEYQTSFAELSQTEDTIDPHLRSFVFESSQTDTGTEL